MSRRSLSFTLLALLALQLLGGIALASVCVESCPDEADEASCPPVCAVCTGCTHAQSAIIEQTESSTRAIESERYRHHLPSATPWQLPTDVFHVPLLG